jgi:hypothetical protein
MGEEIATYRMRDDDEEEEGDEKSERVQESQQL